MTYLLFLFVSVADVPVIETSTDSGSISEGLFSSICSKLYHGSSRI